MADEKYLLAQTGANTDKALDISLAVLGPGTELVGTETLTNLDPGVYSAGANTVAAALAAITGNCPTEYNFILYVMKRIPAPRKTLVIVDMNSDVFIKSQTTASAWGAWKKVTTTTA